MEIAKVPLCLLPTPLHRLDRLSDMLGVDLWIKRDDLTGFGLGGNKGRKLELLMADVLASGAQTVVSCGATQSNFLRQLGAACAVEGVECVAVCMDSPFLDASVAVPSRDVNGGNAALDEWFGIRRIKVDDGTWDSLADSMESIAQAEESAGRTVYRIPVGGSTPQGVLAFYQAAEELAKQVRDLHLQPFSAVVTASSSGSTQVGLTTYFHGSSTRVVGIACDPEPEIPHDMADLSKAFVEEFGIGHALQADDFEFWLEWVGEGYGVPSIAGEEATKLLAQKEGILLDQVYTGKAFSGLLGLIERGELSGRILFWHTGGIPARFAY